MKQYQPPRMMEQAHIKMNVPDASRRVSREYMIRFLAKGGGNLTSVEKRCIGILLTSTIDALAHHVEITERRYTE